MGLDTIKVGFVYNIVLCRKSVIGAEQTWDRANGQDLPSFVALKSGRLAVQFK